MLFSTQVWSTVPVQIQSFTHLGFSNSGSFIKWKLIEISLLILSKYYQVTGEMMILLKPFPG